MTGVDTGPAGSSRTGVVRPPGLVVFAVVLGLLGLAWWMYADTLLRRGVEESGASLMGARVDLESADLRALEGSIRLTGLQVTNPDRPMTNLFEADEIVGDLMLGPLLERKLVIERLVVTGVRFNTERETSGALGTQDAEAGQLWRQVNGWAEQIQIPELNLEGLGGVVRTEALSPDSLRTARYARSMGERSDSMQQEWGDRLTALDPRPRIDAAGAMAERLESFRLTPLNALQLPALLRDGRSTLDGVRVLQQDLGSLDEVVQSGLSTLQLGDEVLADLRRQDLAYAASLLNIPSLEAPTVSPALFGGTALLWLKPVLYWARAAERLLPPGLDPRQGPGPARSRAQGTTYDFREGARYPGFLLQEGDLGLELPGTGASAGAYSARIRGLTSAPALLGEPMEITVSRAGAERGPTGLALTAVFDHTGSVLRDSISMSMSGVSLPRLTLGSFGGGLDLGEGESRFALKREGEQIEARLHWVSENATATRTDVPGATAEDVDNTQAPIGSAAWARDLVWGAVSATPSIELDMAISGTLANPSLEVSSNLGEAVAAALRREVGREVAAAEARVRAEVDAQIQPVIEDARRRVAEVRSGVGARLADRQAEVDDIRARIEARLQALRRDSWEDSTD